MLRLNWVVCLVRQVVAPFEGYSPFWLVGLIDGGQVQEIIIFVEPLEAPNPDDDDVAERGRQGLKPSNRENERSPLGSRANVSIRQALVGRLGRRGASSETGALLSRRITFLKGETPNAPFQEARHRCCRHRRRRRGRHLRLRLVVRQRVGLRQRQGLHRPGDHRRRHGEPLG